jgi:PAP2 superfamily protein
MLGPSDRSGDYIHEHDFVSSRTLMQGTIVCALLVLGGYLLFVNTRWGQLLDNAAYSGRNSISRALIDYDHLMLNTISVSTLVLAIVFILAAGAFRRCFTAGAIVAVGFICAVAGGELLKHTLPWHALVPSDTRLPLDLQRHTYPSGHTTFGTSLAIALILVSSTRWRPWIAAIAGLLSASFATGVLFVGWHRPSDALGGIFWSGFCMSLAALSVVALRGKPIDEVQPATETFLRRSLIIVAAVAVAATAWQIHGRQIAVQLPFLILTLLITMSSMGIVIWFGWQLRSVDWVE